MGNEKTISEGNNIHLPGGSPHGTYFVEAIEDSTFWVTPAVQSGQLIEAPPVPVFTLFKGGVVLAIRRQQWEQIKQMLGAQAIKRDTSRGAGETIIGGD